MLEDIYENSDSPFLQEARANLNNNSRDADNKPPILPPKARDSQIQPINGQKEMSKKKLSRLNTLKKTLKREVQKCTGVFLTLCL